MSKILTISDNIEVDMLDLIWISDIKEINKNTTMFCFTLELKNGSFRNIYLHFNEHNKAQIKQKAIELRKKIKFQIEQNRKAM